MGLEVRVKQPQRNWLNPGRELLLQWAAMNTSGLSPFFRFLPKSFLHMHQPMEKINSNPTCFYLQTTPANSCKCNISHPDILDKHAADEQCSTGKSGDRKRSVCFHIWQAGYILGKIRGVAESCAVCSGNRTEGWERDASSSGVTSLSELCG